MIIHLLQIDFLAHWFVDVSIFLIIFLLLNFVKIWNNSTLNKRQFGELVVMTNINLILIEF